MSYQLFLNDKATRPLCGHSSVAELRLYARRTLSDDTKWIIRDHLGNDYENADNSIDPPMLPNVQDRTGF